MQSTLPADTKELAAWFAEGVRAEIAALERNGGAQTYEIHSGKLLESKGLSKVFLHLSLQTEHAFQKMLRVA